MLNADQCASPFRRLPGLSMIMHIIKSRKLVGEIYGIMKLCRAVRPSVRKWCNNVQEDVICTCSGNDMCPKIGERYRYARGRPFAGLESDLAILCG